MKLKKISFLNINSPHASLTFLTLTERSLILTGFKSLEQIAAAVSKQEQDSGLIINDFT